MIISYKSAVREARNLVMYGSCLNEYCARGIDKKIHTDGKIHD